MFNFLNSYLIQLDKDFKAKKLTTDEVFRQVSFLSDYYKDPIKGIIPKKGYVYKCNYKQNFLSGEFIVTDIKKNIIILKPFEYNKRDNYYLTYTTNIEIKAKLNKQRKIIFNGGVFEFDKNFNYDLKTINKTIELNENRSFKINDYYHNNYDDIIKIIKTKGDELLIQLCFCCIYQDRTEVKTTNRFEWINKNYLSRHKKLYNTKRLKIAC